MAAQLLTSQAAAGEEESEQGRQFALAGVAADSASWAGDYWVEAKLTDAAGNFRHTSPVIVRVAADIITS